MPSAGGATASRAAVVAGFICNLLWGSVPILFMSLGHLGASSWEIVAQRAMWSVPWAAALVIVARQQAEVRAILASPQVRRHFGLTLEV